MLVVILLCTGWLILCGTYALLHNEIKLTDEQIQNSSGEHEGISLISIWKKS